MKVLLYNRYMANIYNNVPFSTEQRVDAVVPAPPYLYRLLTPASASGGFREILYVKIIRFNGRSGNANHPINNGASPREEPDQYLYDVQVMTDDDKKAQRNRLAMKALNNVYKAKKVPGGPGPLTETGELAGIYARPTGPVRRGGKTRKSRKSRKTRKARKTRK